MTTENRLYLPGLNGIRAIAVIGVMLSHINIELPTFNIKNFSLFGFNKLNEQNGWNLGEQGVTMFFVLSGFLITYLLLLEKEKTNNINKLKFYLRRILRIWPLYYLYFFATIIIFYFTENKFPTLGKISFYVFLLANIPFITSKVIPICSHLWSIAVEEQFYLFWVHCFKKLKNIEIILMITIFTSIIIRLFLWYFYPFRFFTLLFTVNRFDCMLFGALIAFFKFNNNKILRILNQKFTQIFAWLIVLLHILNLEIINSIISLEFMTLATGIIIIGQIEIKNRFINLENKITNFLGKYSYGIYVWHPLIIYLISKIRYFDLIENENLKSGLIFITIITISIFTAYLSYEKFEKKFIKLKDKYSIVLCSNSSKEKN
jgi:peptidoglycan/LPS O-acetylase OafA/YrhL